MWCSFCAGVSYRTVSQWHKLHRMKDLFRRSVVQVGAGLAERFSMLMTMQNEHNTSVRCIHFTKSSLYSRAWAYSKYWKQPLGFSLMLEAVWKFVTGRSHRRTSKFCNSFRIPFLELLFQMFLPDTLKASTVTYVSWSKNNCGRIKYSCSLN